jgi:hypothetical protein
MSKRLKKTEAQLQAVLFTSKSSTPNSWKAASAAFRCGPLLEAPCAGAALLRGKDDSRRRLCIPMHAGIG